MSAPQPVLKLRPLVIGLFLGLTLALNSIAPPVAEANPLVIIGVMVAVKMLENKPRKENAYWQRLDRPKKNRYAIRKWQVLKKQRANMVKKGASQGELARMDKTITLWRKRIYSTGGMHKTK